MKKNESKVRWKNFMHRVIIDERDDMFTKLALQCVGFDQNELIYSKALLRVPPEVGITAFLHQPPHIQRTLLPLLGTASLVVCVVGLKHVAGMAAKLESYSGIEEVNA